MIVTIIKKERKIIYNKKKRKEKKRKNVAVDEYMCNTGDMGPVGKLHTCKDLNISGKPSTHQQRSKMLRISYSRVGPQGKMSGRGVRVAVGKQSGAVSSVVRSRSYDRL